MLVPVFVVAVFFATTLVRSALAFGEALIAVPLVAFVLPVEIAAPVAVLVSITVAIVVLAQDLAARQPSKRRVARRLHLARHSYAGLFASGTGLFVQAILT